MPQLAGDRIDLERVDEHLHVALIAEVATLAELGYGGGKEGIAGVEGWVLLVVIVMFVTGRLWHWIAPRAEGGFLNHPVRDRWDAEAPGECALGVQDCQLWLCPRRDAEQKASLWELWRARVAVCCVAVDGEAMVPLAVDLRWLGGVGRDDEVEHDTLRVGPEDVHCIPARVVGLSFNLWGYEQTD
jgi:hypothetical protein